jgi:hypothetical protein
MLSAATVVMFFKASSLTLILVTGPLVTYASVAFSSEQANTRVERSTRNEIL